MTYSQTATNFANKGKRHYPLLALTAVNFFFYADRYILFILVEPIRKEFSLTDGEMGMLTGLSFAIAYCLFAIPLGRLTDRSSRIVIISVAAVGWSLATAAFSLSKTYVQMVALRSCVAIGEAGGYVAIQSLIADMYKPEKRAKAMAVVFGVGNLGMIFAYTVAGAVSDTYGWRSGFLFLGLLGLALGPIFYFTVKEPPRGATEGIVISEQTASLLSALSELWLRKSYVLIVFGYMTASVGSFSVLIWMPTYLLRRFDLTLTEVGLLSSVGAVGPMLIGMAVAGFVSEALYRKNPKWVIWLPAIGMLTSTLFLILQVSSPLLPLAILAGAIPSFVSGLYIPSLMAAMQNISGARLRGTAAAITAFASMLVGQGVGPALTGFMSDYFSAGDLEPSFRSLQYALASISSLFLVTSGLLMMAARFFQADIKAARRFDALGSEPEPNGEMQ